MSDLEVLGAGFGRTGTMSLYLALNQLGYKTHHMKEVLGNPAQPAAWLKATRDRAAGRGADLSQCLAGYTAAVDWPSVSFLRELLAANPQAKVVLTLRDFDSWYESALNTIYRVNVVTNAIRPPFYLAGKFRGFTDMFTMTEELIWQQTFGGRFEDKEGARQVYESHLAEVRRTVPAGQLLEFDLKAGWGPLCAFLGKPLPDAPFPRANDTAEFTRIIQRFEVLSRNMRVLSAAGNAVMAAVLAAAAALLVTKLRGRR